MRTRSRGATPELLRILAEFECVQNRAASAQPSGVFARLSRAPVCVIAPGSGSVRPVRKMLHTYTCHVPYTSYRQREGANNPQHIEPFKHRSRYVSAARCE